MSEIVNGSMQELYSTLAGGATLRMSFPDAKAAESFRIAFTKHKAAQDARLLAIGFVDKDALQSFSFIRKREETSTYELCFRGKKAVKTYSFVIVSNEKLGPEPDASCG